MKGKYTKHNNNWGFVSPEDRNTPQACPPPRRHPVSRWGPPRGGTFTSASVTAVAVYSARSSETVRETGERG